MEPPIAITISLTLEQLDVLRFLVREATASYGEPFKDYFDDYGGIAEDPEAVAEIIAGMLGRK